MKQIALLLVGLIFIAFSPAHSVQICNFSISLLFLISLYIIQSSAKSLIQDSIFLQTSLTYTRLFEDDHSEAHLYAGVPIFKMFHPSSNTARTHAHTSICTLKSLVYFWSGDFLLHKKFNDSMLVRRHIGVGHCVRSDIGHVMQATDVTKHSTAGSIYHHTLFRLLFPGCMQNKGL
jgi:hypothetical protein